MDILFHFPHSKVITENTLDMFVGGIVQWLAVTGP